MSDATFFEDLKKSTSVYLEPGFIRGLFRALDSRALNLGYPLLWSLKQIGDNAHILYYSEREEEEAVISLAMDLAILVRFLYPMMEQIDKLIDDKVEIRHD